VQKQTLLIFTLLLFPGRDGGSIAAAGSCAHKGEHVSGAGEASPAVRGRTVGGTSGEDELGGGVEEGLTDVTIGRAGGAP